MRHLSITGKLLALVALPLLGLALFAGWILRERWQVYHANVALEQNSVVLQQIGATVHERQKERGRSAGYLGSKGTIFTVEPKAQRAAKDAALTKLDALLGTFDTGAFGATFQQTLAAGLATLHELHDTRAAISSLTISGSQSLIHYTQTIATLLDVVVAMSHLSDDACIANGISGYVNYLQAKEQAGLERATLSTVFSSDAFTPETYSRFNQVSAAQATFLRVFESFATEAQRKFHREAA